MFYPFRPRYACILTVLGLAGLLSISACDGLDPCQQFTRDYDEFIVQCGGDPPEVDEAPDCTEPVAQRARCHSQCLEDASCKILELGTPEQMAFEPCVTSCVNEHLPD